MRRISRFALAAAMAVSAVALAVTVDGTAAHAQSAAECPQAYPPTQCRQMQVSSTTVVPGGTVTVSGSGFAPNSTVFIEIRPDGRQLGQVTTDASGAFSTTVTIPADTEPGRYRLVATGQDPSGAALTLAAAITVTDANAGRRRPTETGNETGASRRTEVLGNTVSRSSGGGKASAGNQRAASSSSSLPRTGSSSTGELIAVAAGLLTIGSTLLVIRRRWSTPLP